MVLEDAVSKSDSFVWTLNHISRSITWSLFTLKASYDQSQHDLIFHVVVSVKFETRQSSLLNFGTANKNYKAGTKHAFE